MITELNISIAKRCAGIGDPTKGRFDFTFNFCTYVHDPSPQILYFVQASPHHNSIINCMHVLHIRIPCQFYHIQACILFIGSEKKNGASVNYSTSWVCFK